MSRRSTRRSTAGWRSVCARNSAKAPPLGNSFNRRQQRPRQQSHRQLRLEPLEDRRLLAITVTTLGDTIDFNDGKTSLREAIFAANTVPGADTIEFAESLTAGGPATILLTQGELKITDSLSIDGPGADLLTIDASGNDPTPDVNDSRGSRVFMIDDGTAANQTTNTISGLRLTGGDLYGRGGAIFSLESLTIANSVISGNAIAGDSQGFGGGVFAGRRAGGTTPTLSVRDSEISGNSTNRYGGGIAGHNAIVEISGSTFKGNSAGSGAGASLQDVKALISTTTFSENKASRGGGLFTLRGEVSVSDCWFKENSANSGGGIHSNESSLLVSDSRLIKNRATYGDGGAIAGSGVTIVGSELSYNTASRDGGGIYGSAIVDRCNLFLNTADGSGGGIFGRDLRVVNSSLSGNLAYGDGGAIASDRGNLEIVASMIYGNTSDRAGGGVYHNAAYSYGMTIRSTTIAWNNSRTGGGLFIRGGAYGPSSVEHATIVHNRANFGGGAYLAGNNIALRHSILAENQASLGRDLTGLIDTEFALAYSLVGSNSNSGLAEAPVGAPDARGNLIGGPVHGTIDPLLQEVSYGITPTFPDVLVAFVPDDSSPAVDAGDPNAMAGLDGVPEFDERGAPYGRVAGGRIDIGAIEVQPGGLLLGDYHRDRVVDTRDYTVWRDSVGAVVPPGTGADGNGDGVVDQLDHEVWKSSFGARGFWSTAAIEVRDATTRTVSPGVNHIASSEQQLFTHGTILVTTLGDTIDFNDGKTSLREAIFAANTVPGADTIEFAPALTAAGPTTILLNRGELAISEELNIVGPGATQLSIDARRQSRIFNVTASVGDFGFSHLTLTGGQTFGDAANWLDTTYSGGAIRSNSVGMVTVSDSIVGGNQVNGKFASGGGVFASGSLNLSRSVVNNNRTMLVTSPVAGLYSGSGGGVEAIGPITIDRSRVSENSSYGAGGGVRSGNSTVTVTSSLIDNNEGNGIWGIGVTLRQSQVTGNRATLGAGILSGSDTNVFYSTITDNTLITTGAATNRGGGIYAVHGTITIAHSIVAGNHGLNEPDIHSIAGKSQSAKLDVRNSIIGSNTGTILSETDASYSDSAGNLIGGPVHGSIDPLLGPLADNGGFQLPDGSRILTHALLAGSPAINAGDLNAVAGQGGVLEFDQRGEPFGRIVGGRIDIGAFEFQTPTDLNLVVDSLVDESDGDYSRGDLSLREAIELANASRIDGVVDTIRFDPALTASGPATILLTLGELKVVDSLAIDGPGADLLSIDASGNDPTPDLNNGDGSRVFNVDNFLSDAAIDVSIRSLTLTGGDTSGMGGAIKSGSNLTLAGMSFVANSAISGAGVYSELANLSIESSRFVENHGDRGVAIFERGGELQVVDTEISGSSVRSTLGSIVQIENAEAGFDRVTIENNLVSASGNSVVRAMNSNLKFDGCSISGNESAFGIYVDGGRKFHLVDTIVSGNDRVGVFLANLSAAEILVSGSTVRNNGQAGIDMRGIDGAVTIANCTIIDNGGELPSLAGGLSVRMRSGSVAIRDCIVSGNRVSVPAGQIGLSTTAGGIGLYLNSASAVIERTTISDNHSTVDGAGGLSIRADSVAIRDCEVTGNTGPASGGIQLLRSSAIVERTLVAENQAKFVGGGIFSGGGGSLEVVECRIVNNLAAIGGGLATDGQARVIRSTISGNQVVANGPFFPRGDGAGIHANSYRGARLVVGARFLDRRQRCRGMGWRNFCDGHCRDRRHYDQ